MTETLLAIDPGSNSMGVALFEAGRLVAATSLKSDKISPLERRLDMAHKIKDVVDISHKFTSEEPLLLGRNNNGMQRLLGYIELITEGKVEMIHPMTLKKIMGSGSSDKLDMALAAGDMLTDTEQEIMAKLIANEDFDATDAVCVGLAYLKKVRV